MDKIVMVDLQQQYLSIKDEIDSAIAAVINSSAFIQGPAVKEFAGNLARYVNSASVIPCANGTDALQIGMMALDLKPGDEVILPVHTYVATAEVIALLGLTPVFIDVNSDTFNLDVGQLEGKITSKTRAVVPVHLYGQCADMEAILEIAARRNLAVIEDCAQALGARYQFRDGSMKRAGTMGTVGTTSFFPSKNLGCFGDGGAIFTQDPFLAEKIRMMANHGQRVKYEHDIIGVNSRLDTLQAAVLNVKLKYLNEYERKRNEAAAFYDKALTEIDGVQIPFRANNSTHVFHQYTLKAARRDALKKHLEDSGVPTMIYYPIPLHFQKAYQRPGFGKGSFPVTEKLSDQVISLPIHTEMKAGELEFICKAIERFYHGG